MGEAGRGARGGGCRAAGLGLQPMQSPRWGLLQGRGRGSRPPVGTGVAGVPAVSTSDAHLPPPALAGASWPLCSSAVSQQTLPGLSGWHCRNETGAGGSKRGPCHRQRPARGGLGRVAGGCYSDLADPTCSPRTRCPASLPHLLGEGLGPWEVSSRSEVTEPLSSVSLPATSAHALHHCHAASSWLPIHSFTHSFNTYLSSTYCMPGPTWGLVCGREQESTAPSPGEPTAGQGGGGREGGVLKAEGAWGVSPPTRSRWFASQAPSRRALCKRARVRMCSLISPACPERPQCACCSAERRRFRAVAASVWGPGLQGVVGCGSL